MGIVTEWMKVFLILLGHSVHAGNGGAIPGKHNLKKIISGNIIHLWKKIRFGKLEKEVT
jgi:hypothetical protein